MMDIILKLLSGQALGTGPALEQPITRLKYDLAGSLLAGGLSLLAVLALAAGLYFWLVSAGLQPFAALLVVGGILLLVAVIVWVMLARARDKALAELAAEQKSSPRPDPVADLTSLLAGTLQDVALSFVEGLKDARAEKRASHPVQSPYAAAEQSPGHEPAHDHVQYQVHTPNGAGRQ